MAIEKKGGTEFQTGMFESDKGIAQSGSKAAAGELRVYRDEDGAVCSVYKIDPGSKSFTFEALLTSSASLPLKGERIVVDGNASFVESADLIYQNDEVKKIRVTAKYFTTVSPTTSGS